MTHEELVERFREYLRLVRRPRRSGSGESQEVHQTWCRLEKDFDESFGIRALMDEDQRQQMFGGE